MKVWRAFLSSLALVFVLQSANSQTITRVPLPKIWKSTYNYFWWTGRNRALIAISDHQDEKTYRLRFYRWNTQTRRLRRLPYVWRHAYDPIGGIVPSRDGRHFLYTVHFWGSYVRDWRGNSPDIWSFGHSKYIYGSWFDDGVRWTDHYIPLKFPQVVRIASRRTRKSYILRSLSKAHPVISGKIQTIQGHGNAIYTLELPTWAAHDAMRDYGKPIRFAFVNRMRLENRFGRYDFPLERGVRSQYVAYRSRKKIVFPRPLCVKFATFSPDARRVAWILYEPHSEKPGESARTMVVGVSGAGFRGLKIVGRWKTTEYASSQKIHWMPHGDGFSFDMNGNEKLYLVRLNR